MKYENGPPQSEEMQKKISFLKNIQKDGEGRPP